MIHGPMTGMHPRHKISTVDALHYARVKIPPLASPRGVACAGGRAGQGVCARLVPLHVVRLPEPKGEATRSTRHHVNSDDADRREGVWGEKR